MTIQWFPGHMAKARRQVEEKLKLVDIVFELLDARIPFSSRNPMIDEIIGAKPRLILLNKEDISAVTGNGCNLPEKGLAPYLSIPGQAREQTDCRCCAEVLKKTGTPAAERGKTEGDTGDDCRDSQCRQIYVNQPSCRQKYCQNGECPRRDKSQQWIKVGRTLELLHSGYFVAEI